MEQIYRIGTRLSWALGLLSLLAAVILRVSTPLIERTMMSPRGALEFAGALFLCAMATRAQERT